MEKESRKTTLKPTMNKHSRVFMPKVSPKVYVETDPDDENKVQE
jgi:hypothetical protein